MPAHPELDWWENSRFPIRNVVTSYKRPYGTSRVGAALGLRYTFSDHRLFNHGVPFVFAETVIQPIRNMGIVFVSGSVKTGLTFYSSWWRTPALSVFAGVTAHQQRIRINNFRLDLEWFQFDEWHRWYYSNRYFMHKTYLYLDFGLAIDFGGSEGRRQYKPLPK